MPLHLLGKKSWNVYNTANIERVRKDEEEARLKEEAEEQRQQQEDSARRIGLLRGQQDALPAAASDSRAELADANANASRKRRRIHGEDDTDRDLRYAREDIKQGEEATKRLRRDNRMEKLYDDRGHMQLFSAPPDARTAPKSKSTQTGDTFGEQFNRKQPWYASNDHTTKSEALSMLPNIDAWGRDDDRRKDREVKRMTSSDPLAAMKAAQSQLKRSTAEKAQWTRRSQSPQTAKQGSA